MYKSKSVRLVHGPVCQLQSEFLTFLMPFCDHLLQQPVNPLASLRHHNLLSSQSAGSTFSQPQSRPPPNKCPTNKHHIKKKYHPYLELESENILTLTLSQAPAFVCFYICTQSLTAAVFCLFVGMSGFHRSPAPLENTASASD